MALGITTMSITVLGVVTPSITALGITTLSITIQDFTLSITSQSIMKKCHTEHNLMLRVLYADSHN
jgi:GLTT repeat (6 copies)